MIGKTIFPSNNSQLKDNLNSKLFFSSQKELHSICSKPKKRRTTSNFTLEEYSSWTIVMNWSQNTWTSLKVLSTLKIYHWIFQENSYNTIKFLKLLKKISSKKLLKCSLKSLKTPKTIKNSTNNSEKILN